MKTFLLFLVVLSCSTYVLCGQPQDIQSLLLQFPKNWKNFSEICDLVGIKVEPDDMKTLQKVWSGMINIAKNRLNDYLAHRN